jgi:hypothetical protein
MAVLSAVAALLANPAARGHLGLYPIAAGILRARSLIGSSNEPQCLSR